MAVAVGGWALGLGAMWAAKWMLAWLFVDRERIVDSVRNQISFRTGGEYEGVADTPLTGFTKNVSYWLDRPLTPLVWPPASSLGAVAGAADIDSSGRAVWIAAAIVAVRCP